MKFNKTQHSARTIARWLWTHHKSCHRQAIANVVIGLMQVGGGLLGVEVLRQLTDIATGKQEGNLIMMAGLYLAIMLFEFICSISHTWITSVLGVKAQNEIQMKLFERLLHGKWSGIEKFHSGDVLNRLFGDVDDIVSLITEVLPFMTTLAVQFVASLIYLFTIDQALAFILLICSPIFAVLSRLYFFRMRRVVRKVKDSNSRLQALIQESIQHKMIIKVMEMEERMVGQLGLNQSLLRWQVKTRAKLSMLARTFIFIGFRGGAIVALTYGLQEVQQGAITMGVLMAFTQLVGRIQHPLIDFGRLLPTLINSLTSSERLMELESLPLETYDEGNEAELEPYAQNKNFGIRFEGLSYSYPGTVKQVFNKFDYTIQPNSFTAILGETGRGKTTLLRLMLALIEPTAGEINLIANDGSKQRITHKSRTFFSYVPQGNSLFSGTIRDNLRMGNANATSDDMMSALKIAKADFVGELPHGLDTFCGEQGGGLSEGQAQRIAIARAILKPCKILLLDEATSALDLETEKAVLCGIKEHFQNTTVIFVTHRLSAVDFATEQITL